MSVLVSLAERHNHTPMLIVDAQEVKKTIQEDYGFDQEKILLLSEISSDAYLNNILVLKLREILNFVHCMIEIVPIALVSRVWQVEYG